MNSRIFLAAGLLSCSMAAVAADKPATPDDALHRDAQRSTALDLGRDASPAGDRAASPGSIDLARLRVTSADPTVSVSRLRPGSAGTFLKF